MFISRRLSQSGAKLIVFRSVEVVIYKRVGDFLLEIHSKSCVTHSPTLWILHIFCRRLLIVSCDELNDFAIYC